MTASNKKIDEMVASAGEVFIEQLDMHSGDLHEDTISKQLVLAARSIVRAVIDTYYIINEEDDEDDDFDS